MILCKYEAQIIETKQNTFPHLSPLSPMVGSGCLLWYFATHHISIGASLIAQLVKNLPAMQETLVQFLGWEDPLEKGKATHSSVLAWRIPWTVCPWPHEQPDVTEWISLSRLTVDVVSSAPFALECVHTWMCSRVFSCVIFRHQWDCVAASVNYVGLTP